MRLPRLLHRKTAAHSSSKGVEAVMRVPSTDRARRVISIVVAVTTMLGTFGVVMTQGAQPAAAATSPTWTDSFSFQGSTANCGTFQSVALPATTTSITSLVVAGGGAGSAGGSGNGTSGAGGYGGKVSASTVTVSDSPPTSRWASTLGEVFAATAIPVCSNVLKLGAVTLMSYVSGIRCCTV